MKGFQLSTGTKCILLIFYTGTLSVPFPIPLEMVSMGFVVFLLTVNHRLRAGVKVLVAFLGLRLLYFFTGNQLGPAQVLHTWSLLLRRFLIPLGIGYYFMDTTNVSSLMAGMEKMRFPKAIIISLLVMFRYMPVLKEEYGKIKDAMKIRGIEPGLRSLKNPSLSLEYLLVPLLFSTSNIGEELSQAAFAKGIGIDGKKDRFFATSFKGYDGLVFLYLGVFVFLLLREGP